ncbi:TonB-dependent receptor plug domain-containing protein [Caenibius tardaugens]|uniref:TonB-dependent receptor plug domain-containing protein n=1 Tax=Caenibius tardaugens TaxID=169176 RepID=UPI000593F001|nr:TonB-dependent receptor [Caenibius tardaugens]AZI35283.1 TonB-dependent receptor [Caenibius tardaugens NBRC 16725]
MKTCITICASSALLALATAAHANEGEHADNSKDARADNIVVTADRLGDGIAYDLVGGSVTLLDARTLADRQTRNVSDILRDVPGLAVNRIAGLTQIRMRGAEGDHTLVLVDGIEVSDPYHGEFDFGTLIADDGARIEVLRGQQSALYGSDAIGGVIHYITGSGAEAPGLRLRAEVGSWNSVNAGARIAGVSGNLDYALTASLVSTDGVPDAIGGTRDLGRDTIAASFKIRWDVAPNARLIAVGRYSWSDLDFNNSDYRSGSPTFGYSIDSPGSFVRSQAIYGLVRAEVELLDGRWTHNVSTQFADINRDGYDYDAPSYGDRGNRIKASYDTALRFGSPRVQHRIGFAVDLEDERYRNTDPSGYAFTGTRSNSSVGLVGSYDLNVDDRLAVGGSLRFDNNQRFDSATTYRVQGSYRFGTGTRLRAAAGSGVKNPGFYALFGYVDGRYIGNPNLRPEKSRGWEVGLEQSLANDAVLLGVTWFQSRLKGEIYTSYPAPDYFATPANRTSDSTQRGIESFAAIRLGDAWRIDLSYSWLKARENGVEEVRRPRHIGSAAISWHAPADRASATLVVRHNGDQIDLAYTNPNFIPDRVVLDAFTTVNFNATLALSPAVTLNGRIENMLNEKYTELFGFRAAGRALFVGVNARF